MINYKERGEISGKVWSGWRQQISQEGGQSWDQEQGKHVKAEGSR